jgi:Arc/MetJ family transcription regulator
MKTTIDIPDDLMKEAVRYTKATTKRDAVVGGLREFVRRQKVDELVKLLGTSDTFMSNEQLMEMRQERGRYAPKRAR